MTRKYLKFTDYLVEKLKNPTEAEAFLDAATTAYEEDGNTTSFMLALRYLTEAQGGVRALSDRTHLDRKTFIRYLQVKPNQALPLLCPSSKA
ncbi:MAG: putative transcriptional regulator [Candidatus Midichloriaceae bacterium]|nr:putative transcriptional regulator [Candidatus Midichloriaceae bacterium]